MILMGGSPWGRTALPTGEAPASRGSWSDSSTQLTVAGLGQWQSGLSARLSLTGKFGHSDRGSSPKPTDYPL